MGLRMTPSLLQGFEALQRFGATGATIRSVACLPIFEAHGLAEEFEDSSRKYRLTEAGQKMADFLFGRRTDE